MSVSGDVYSDEVEIDDELVKGLVQAQFPEYAELSIARVSSAGTDHAMFRLGPELAVRLPRVRRAVTQVHKEQRWLPLFAPELPLPIPTPVGYGQPGAGFDMHWSIYRWLDGVNAFDSPIVDELEAATELGRFGAALRRIDASEGPPSFRGGLLGDQEADVLAAIDDLGDDGIVDRAAALDAWQEIIHLPQWTGEPLWTHGDLLPGNLLVQDGRLAAVIDFGGMGVGDPACDLMAAWTVFDADVRSAFRECSEVDDATWWRGRAWAFGFGLMAYHYHQEKNPILAAVGRRSVSEVLVELDR